MVCAKKQKNRICIIILIFAMVAALMFVFATRSLSAESVPSASGKINASGGAYVRKSPSTSSSRVLTAANGKAFTISYEKFVSSSSNAKSNVWYYTSLGGYIRSDLATISYSSVNGTTSDMLNGRSGAGTGFSIKKVFSKNDALTVVLKAYDSGGKIWYKVKYGSNYYYVSSDYVKLNSSSTSSTSSSSSSSNYAVTAYNTTGTTKDALNARTGPGTSYSVKKTYSKNTNIVIVGKTTISGKVWYKLNTGYFVLSDYVKTAAAVNTTTSSVTSYTAIGTTTAALNARSGAGTSYAVKNTYIKGTKLSIIGKITVSGVTWYRLSNGYYVCGTYVSVATSSNTSTGTTSSSSTSSSSSSAYTAIGITTDVLNARSGPSTGYAVKKTYIKGTKLSLVEKVTTSNVVWYKTSDGYYVCGTYVSVTTTPTTSTTDSSNSSDSSSNTSSTVTAYSATGYALDVLNVRSGPSTSYAVKAVYNKNTTMSIVGKTSTSGVTWYKLSNGYYVCGTYVTFTAPSTSTPSTGNTTGTDTSGMSDSQFTTYLSNQGFPSSYISYLVSLHRLHPSWDFKAMNTGLDWNTALNKMVSSNANLIDSSYKLGYRDVGQGSYNFLTNAYIPKDGSTFFKASDVGVAYFMDPRNWLTESSVFMFEDHAYNSSYQTQAVVEKVLNYNYTLKSAASSFVNAGMTYNINPVYLASKSYSELGTSAFMIDGHTFSYGGKSYSGCYNAFNIGATDTASGSAAVNGLIYANGGAAGTSTSYGRKWNTLTKAILGGAQFLSKDFINNNQDTGYLEHFNVMNGLSSVGTHVYMTAVYAPYSMAWPVYNQYKNYGILDENIVFKVPVYNNMPATAAPKASSGSNNCYLKALSFTDGTNTSNLIICNAANESTLYKTSFSASVANNVSSINITTGTSDSGASVSGAGTKQLSVGTNTFTIVCTAPSGKTRNYTITITRAAN